MNASPARAMTSELRSHLAATIELVLQVTDADAAWMTPWAHSQAGRELNGQERRRPAPQAGSWPWLLAPVVARLALQVAAEEARGFQAVLAPHDARAAALRDISDFWCRRGTADLRGSLDRLDTSVWHPEPDVMFG